MENEIKLTKLASCAGCGAKVGAGVLARLLGDLQVLRDENLLVGFDKSDDASVYKVSEELALYRPWTSSRPSRTIPTASARSRRPMPFRTSTPWAASRSWP